MQDIRVGAIQMNGLLFAVEENLGFKAIADRLTDKGHRARGGRPFASFTVHRILSNEALMGTLTYGKRPRKGNPQPEVVRVPGFFPAALSEEEWQRLQERLTIRRELSRGRAHSSTYLLGGIVRCGQCGGPMSGNRPQLPAHPDDRARKFDGFEEIRT